MLSRYLDSARVARRIFEDYWGKHRGDHGKGDPHDVEFFTRMSIWYALLAAVLEGWEDYGLPSDELSSAPSELREALRRFRNKTLHVQDQFPHPHLVAFIEKEDSVRYAYWLDEQLRIAIDAALRDSEREQASERADDLPRGPFDENHTGAK